ncbi:MAG: Clp protease ClpP [Oscillospiraceae bacterium]|nr:Clp protease ClpP [Oscillospiraceae bacterium]
MAFYRFINKAEGEPAELVIDGPIDSEVWWGDEVTPKAFKAELNSKKGDLTVWINSPGGDCFAASQIYTMLKEYKGKVTVKIDGIAASAASVIAMAGDEVLMAPTAMMMIHNPLADVRGNKADMEQAISVLEEVKESIVNAYEIKTGLQRAHISRLMDEETWMNARKAMELKFADGMIGLGRIVESGETQNTYTYNAKQTAEKIVASAVAFAKRKPTSEPTFIPKPLTGPDDARAADDLATQNAAYTAADLSVDEGNDPDAQTPTHTNESKPDGAQQAQNGTPIDQLLAELGKKKKYL